MSRPLDACPAATTSEPWRRVDLGPRGNIFEHRADGAIVVRHPAALAAYGRSATERLAHWARVAPERVFLARRTPQGPWRTVGSGQAHAHVRSIAQGLLDRGLTPSRPLAVLVGATSSAAGLVQKTLIDNGYQGPIYHTHGAVTRDFLRIAGKDAEGAVTPAGPSAVAEELPADNLSKAPGLAFVKGYEDKNGPGTRTPFAAHACDAILVLLKAMPAALQKAPPGTQAFRIALKQALEGIKELPASQGVINYCASNYCASNYCTSNYCASNHYAMDNRSRVLVTAQGGGWKLLH
jgi:hypothetical protein